MPIAGLLLATMTPATIAGDLALDWWTIDGGGDMWTTGGEIELSGTIGQPDTSTTVLTDGDIELTGGFWVVTWVSEPSPCPGDLDGDGDTDQSDLGLLLAEWGCTSGCAGDLDGDDDTDQADLGILLADWGCGT
jgi:hypothetical protein